MTGVRKRRGTWPQIVQLGAEYVRSQRYPVSLRECHYALLTLAMRHGYGPSDYKQLSEHTAEARRAGRFPELADDTRSPSLRWPEPSGGVAAFLSELPWDFGVDIQEDQPERIALAVEKNTLRAQLEGLRDEYGIPLLPLRGFTSQTFVKRIRRYTRQATVLYIGDLDASGIDIERDFIERGGASTVIRIGVTIDQVQEHGLVRLPGNTKDSRRKRFIERYGANFQVEAEALSAALPDGLAGLVREHIESRLDLDLIAAHVREERRVQQWLRQRFDQLAQEWETT